MLRFLARRLLTAIPVLLGVVILVFVLARVIPVPEYLLGDYSDSALARETRAEFAQARENLPGLEVETRAVVVQAATQMPDFNRMRWW